MKHLDTAAHVRGDAPFVADLPEPPGCLHAAVVASPVSHGRLEAIDPSAALAVEPGAGRGRRPVKGGPWRISVDTGGTFTDAVGIDPGGHECSCKVLSSSALRVVVGGLAGPRRLRLTEPLRLADGPRRPPSRFPQH